jgi:hypothetical protein
VAHGSFRRRDGGHKNCVFCLGLLTGEGRGFLDRYKTLTRSENLNASNPLRLPTEIVEANGKRPQPEDGGGERGWGLSERSRCATSRGRARVPAAPEKALAGRAGP